MTAEPKKIPAPKLRFKQFEGQGEWEEKKLGDITQVVSQRNKSDEKLPIYSISNVDGFVPQSDQFDGVDSHERGYDVSLYKVVNRDTFAYNPARINVGSIGYSGDLDKVLVSSLYVCFKTTEAVNDKFLWNFLKSETFLKAVNDMAEGGIRSYLFYEKFAKIKLYVPPLPEQTHIAACLSSLDAVISAHQSKLEALRQHKRGLMQQLFPQEGEAVPRLRFPEFAGAGEWEEKKLGEVADVKGGKRVPKGHELLNENTGFPYIRVSDVYMGGVETSAIKYISKATEKHIINYKISSDDLFITVAGTIGIVGTIPNELNNANLTENANRIIPKSVNRIFLLQYLMSDNIQGHIAQSITNNAQPKLALERIRNFVIPCPTLPEQKRIAACLSSLDELMGAQADKIVALQEFKRGLMQGLFPRG